VNIITRKSINTNGTTERIFPENKRDFTDINIPSVYTKGIIVGKNN
jgi:hypothetical protein